MSRYFLSEHMPSLTDILCPNNGDKYENLAMFPVLEAAYEFSRMLHGAPSSSGGSIDAFYRAFVPELGNVLHPKQVELVRRCMKSERGEADCVGATVFPGLVKVTRGIPDARGQITEHTQTVVRRAQVICECSLEVAAGLQAAQPQ